MTESAPETLGSAFESVVEQCSDRVAIRSRSEDITYGELNERANRLSHALLDRTARGPVALLLGTTPSSIAGLFAAYKSGAAAVPLDNSAPPSRLAAVLRDSGAGLLVTDSERGAAAAHEAGVPVIGGEGAPGGANGRNPGAAVLPDAPAVILYTSGSTGSPKGIFRTHRTMLASRPAEVGRRSNDRLLLVKSVATGAALGPIYGALLSGGTLLPYAVREGLAGLADWMIAERVTHYSSVPSLFREFARALEPARRFPDLRAVRLGGDSVFWSDFHLFRLRLPSDAVFQVSFASTEAGSIAELTADPAAPEGDGVMPVGKPVEGVEVRVVDEQGREVELGQVGEIEVTGRRLADGYWRDPELTLRVYRPDPTRPDWRILRTGDLGRWNSGGLLEHRGRLDFQVKVRGQRVDLAEIEGHLRASPGILDATVVARGELRRELVAYLVGEPAAHPSRRALRERLRECVPEAFVPSAFVFLESLPRTASGKVDRLSLRAAAPEDYAGTEIPRPPADDLERALQEIWRRVLPARIEGTAESFFDLGGDSLAAAEMLAAIEQRFGRQLALPVLLEAPTIESLARVLREPVAETIESSSVVALRTSGSRLPFFCVPGGNGPGFNFRALSGLLGEDQPFYAFHVKTETGEEMPGTIEEWADRFLPELRNVQSRGPYRLGGHSFGGTVAYELARRLLADGESVEFLALFDTFAPGYPRPLSRGQTRAQVWREFLRRPLTEKLRSAGRTARRAAREAAGGPRPPRWGERGEGRGGLGGSLRTYAPGPLPIPIVLFRASDREEWRGFDFEDPSNGWRPIAGNRLRVHRVAGKHGDLIVREGAAEIARLLDAYLSGEFPAAIPA